MPRFRIAPAVLIAIGGLLTGADGRSAGGDDNRPDAAAVLKRSREAYQKLSTYRFEYDLALDESKVEGPDGPPAAATKLARMAFVNATADAEWRAGKLFFPAFNVFRGRLDRRDERGTTTLFSADGESFFHRSDRNEYVKGSSARDHAGSSEASTFTAISQVVFTPLTEGVVGDLKVQGEADVPLGTGLRKCYVVEGSIPAPQPIGLNDAIDGPFEPLRVVHLTGMVSILGIQASLGNDQPINYGSSRIEERPKRGTPTRIRLWIDRDSGLLLRSRLSARLFKYPPSDKPPAPGDGREVDVTALFEFRKVDTGDEVPKELFQFTPPPGAKEVPNVSKPVREEK